MTLSGLGRAFAGGILACGLMAGLSDGADAQDRIRWKMHSAWGSSLKMLGTGGKRIAESVTALSDGAFRVKFFEPGALLPGINYIDAVGQGSVDAGWGSSGYHAGKAPVVSLFSAVPFGPRAGAYLAWMEFGGGNELYDEIYANFGVKPFVCGILAPEASGWFREEIKSVEDLSGLKMRFYGYGARVMEKFGVSTQLLAGGDIYPALELGTIDAAEFSMPVIDESAGFYQIAKHYYFPGWHQSTSLLELIVNLEAYENLSDHNKKILQTACGDNVMHMLAAGEALQFGAMQRLQEKGVILHRWSPEILAKLEEAWHEVATEESAKDPQFAKVWKSMSEFRENYAIWKEMGYIE